MTPLLRIAATLLLSGLPCSLQTSDGTNVNGELTALDNAQVTILVAEEAQTIPVDQLQKLTTQTKPAKSQPDDAVAVRVVDGSQLIVANVGLKSGSLTLTPWGKTSASDSGAGQEVSRKKIRFVRFRPPTDELAAQWTEILAGEHAGDTLVIRKSAGALDYLEGVVTSIESETITFEYDGDTIPVKRTKLEGILFYQSGVEEEQPDPALIATLADGSELKGESLVVAGDAASFTTLAGMKWTTPATSISQIDFAVGRTLFLSDADPAELEVTPHIASQLSDDLTKLLYQPLRDSGRNGRKLELRFPSDRRNSEYAKGMCLHSRTKISFRLGNQYRKLQTIAGIDPELREGGAVKLTILGDDETLFEEIIKGGEDPREIDLDVSRKRRVTILVDYADKLDIAGRIHLCDLRVTK